MDTGTALSPATRFSFGPFSYDSRNRQLSRDGEVLRTTPKALHVLEVLLRAQGNLVTLEQLTNEVWSGVFVDRTTIHQNVATLRRLLDDDPKAPAFIETVPRLGYRFLHAIQPEPQAVASPVPRLAGARGIGGVAVAATLLACGVLFQSMGRPEAARKSPAQAEYELGRQYWNTRLWATQAEAARQCYRKAIGLDPSFALAHVGLADTYVFENNQTATVEREIRAALSLDPKLGEAYATLGFLRMFHRQDWKGAEEALERCRQLKPNYATGHQWRGTLLLVRGRLDEARAEYERAASLDVLSVPIASDLAAVSYFEGNYSAAAEKLKQVLVRDPSFVFAQRYLLRALLLDGKLAEGLAFAVHHPAMESLVETEASDVSAHAPGSPQSWQALCRSANPYQQAVCWGMAENWDRALEQLEVAVRDRHPLVMYAAVEPALRKLRGNERFRAVLRAWRLDDVPAGH